MEYYDLKVFTSVLWGFTMKFAPLTVYSGAPHVNKGDTSESEWIHQKVGIQVVGKELFT